MSKIRTHYDNLQVSWKASPEVIRAAYKSLVQKWHPDRHPDKREEAERVLRIINQAYEVLSDPIQRERHDQWIEGLVGTEIHSSGPDSQHNLTTRPYANVRVGTTINYSV